MKAAPLRIPLPCGWSISGRYIRPVDPTISIASNPLAIVVRARPFRARGKPPRSPMKVALRPESVFSSPSMADRAANGPKDPQSHFD